MTEETLDGRLAALVGRPIGDSGPSRGPDPVNQPMIRHWAAAFEDANPAYVDDDPVAPPLMLQTWTFPMPKITGMAERGGSPVELEGETVLSVLDDAGYVATLASNSEFEIERHLHLGEVVTSATTLESVSEEKQTRLGAGYFVTWVTTYTVGDGEVVGRQRFRVLKFRPGAA